MNSLSWMIYAAEALGDLKFWSWVAVIVAAAAIGVGVFAAGVASMDDRTGSSKAVLGAILRKWWVPVCLAVVASVTPSSTTVYLIAASEAAETIVTSPEAKEVFEDLKTIIKAKLKEQLPKVEVGSK